MVFCRWEVIIPKIREAEREGAGIVGRNPDLRYERKLWRGGLLAIAGADEAGVGPMAGPVVAAAVGDVGECRADGGAIGRTKRRNCAWFSGQGARR